MRIREDYTNELENDELENVFTIIIRHGKPYVLGQSHLWFLLKIEGAKLVDNTNQTPFHSTLRIGNLVNMEENYFQLLPNEILSKILQYLTTSELFKFCDAYEQYSYFFKERSVIRRIDLSKQYTWPDCLKILSKQIAYECVRIININGLYWIKAPVLRSFIKRCPNLEVLYAVDTALDLATSDVQTYITNKKLRTLALTLRTWEATDLKIPSIESLYLSVVLNGFSSDMNLAKLFPALKNLWISMPHGRISRPPSINSPKKLIVQINYPIIGFWFPQISLYFKKLCPRQDGLFCGEQFDSPVVDNTAHYYNLGKDELTMDAWDILKDSTIFFGPKDTKRLVVGEKGDDIDFEEIDFSHKFCSGRYIFAAKQVLISKNCQKIKRLAVMTCLLATSPSNRKKLKTELGNLEVSSSNIFDNINDLEELEIFECNVMQSGFVDDLTVISKYDKLKYLTIELPHYNDGTFLVEIFKHCTQLKSLRLVSNKINENLNYQITKALPFAQSLEDISYSNDRLQLNKLFTTLGIVKNLTRLTLSGKHYDNKFDENILKEFIESIKPRLVFFFLRIESATKEFMQRIQRIFNVYNKKPEKHFYARKTLLGAGEFGIPDVHYNEMVLFKSRVATFDIYRDAEYVFN